MANHGRDDNQDETRTRLRIARVSAGSELPAGASWALTAALVLAGGLVLYASRGAIGETLDRWLPRVEPPAPEAAPPEMPAAAPAPEAPAEPEWTFVDVEAAIMPLPERAETLIAEGRAELPDFSDLESTDPDRARLIANRWRLWGQIWHNRVVSIRDRMPPTEVCEVHAALEPTCRALADSLALLDRVAPSSNVEAATELLDDAAAILDALRLSQEPDDAMDADSAPAESDPP